MGYPPLSVALISVSVVFPTLAFVAVALRVKARLIKRTRLDVSDYSIFLACFTCLGQLIIGVIGGTIGGLGRPLTSLDAHTSTIFMQVLFVMQFFHHFAVFYVKLSLVLFYKSIFPTRRFKLVSNYTIGVLVAWIIAFFFATLFQDQPISRNWGTNGTTIDYPVFYIVENVTDIILDIYILCMPMPVISSLHIDSKKKWMIGCVFGLGFFCVIAGAVRLYYLVVFEEQYTGSLLDPFSYSTVNYMIWNTIEPCASIVTACLPTYIPLLQSTRLGHWIRSVGSGISNSLSTKKRFPTWSKPKPKKQLASSITNLTEIEDDWGSKSSNVAGVETRCETLEIRHSSAVTSASEV